MIYLDKLEFVKRMKTQDLQRIIIPCCKPKSCHSERNEVESKNLGRADG